MEDQSNKRQRLIETDYTERFHPSIIAFNNFVSSRVSSNKRFSHKTSSGVFYFIEDDHYDTFLNLLCNASSFKDFHFNEYPTHIFPALFKFKFVRSFVQPFISTIVSNLFKTLKSLLKLDIFSKYEQCLFISTKDNQQEFYIFFPNIVIFKNIFHMVRDIVINNNDVLEKYDDLGYENTINECFVDEIEIPIVSSIDLYEFSGYNCLGETCDETSFFENSDTLTFMHFFSIRTSKLSEVAPLSVLGDVSLKINPDNLYTPDFILQMVDFIDPEKVNDIDIIWSLINIQNQSGQDLFHVASHFCGTFELNQWDFMKSNPSPETSKLGMTSLIYFASIHSVNSYRKFIFENIWIFIKNSCDKYVNFYLEEENDGTENAHNEVVLKAKFQQFDTVCFYLASIANLMYGHIFVCSNISRKSWFFFNGINWIKSNRAVHLSKLFETDFYSLFNYWSVAFSQEDVSNELLFLKQNYSKCCSDFAAFLRNHLKKKMMIDVCAEHFYWDFQHILNKNVKSSNFEEILDTNVLLIGLQNGVYDLSSHMFRSAKPDDFIFLTTKNSYCEFSWTHVVVLEILDFFRKVFPNQTIRNYVLKLFASFMDGNIEEQFYIFTGTGSNGKSKLVELFQLTMGEYVGTLPVSLITGKRTPSSSATPELARMKGKRLGVLHESNVTDALNLGLIKAISGGDNMYARALHSDPIEFRPTFQLLLLCNDKPKRIDPYDFATWRRIIVLNFNSSFLENPDPENPLHFQKDSNLHTKLPLWKEAFFWILTQHYHELRNIGNPVPDEIIIDTKNYRDSNDYVAIFIKTHLKPTRFFNDVIYLEDVFARFKVFYSNHYQEQSKLKFAEFCDIIVVKLGPLVIFNQFKKGWTHFIYV